MKIRRVGDGAREVQAYPGVWVIVATGDEVEVSQEAAYGSGAGSRYEGIDGAPLVCATGGLLDQTDQWAIVKVKKPARPDIRETP